MSTAGVASWPFLYFRDSWLVSAGAKQEERQDGTMMVKDDPADGVVGCVVLLSKSLSTFLKSKKGNSRGPWR
eukprot:scaffold22573_cov160-Cylindrotheca_fusiformis.AAC.1